MKKSASSHKNAQKKANSSPVQLSTLEQLRKENQELHQTVAQLEHDLQIAHDTLNQFYESDTFKLVRYYARIRNFLLPPNSLRFRLLRKVFVGIKKMLGLRHGNPRTAPVSQLVQLQDMGKYKQMDIITTKHTMFIARLIKKQLDRINVKCHIHVGQPSKYDNIPYIIICPQFVQTFPPVYFVFQMEQTVSSRWFTDSYNISLQNSCGILDYSLENVAFFHKPKYRDITSRVYYVPIDYCADYLPADKPVKKEYDVLFYGDPNCERRQRLLNALSKHFKVKICSEVFGDALYDEIRKAKVLINIHYYENSLLETTRLYEALSLNTCVIVSEDSHDQHEIGRLKEYVDFVPIDDEQAMIDRIAYWLSHDAEREEKVRTNQLGLEKRANAFDFFFYRFLLAHDRITFEDFYRLAGDYVQLHSNRICLSLPESTERRKSFDQDNIYGFECFPGLRHQKGWVGCGLS